MDFIANIWTFETAHFTVSVDALADYDLDLSFDDTGEVRAKLETGEYTAFCARCTVTHDTLGEVGADYLGGCIYADISEFRDHLGIARETRRQRAARNNPRLVIGSYFSDMVRAAIFEARGRIEAAKNIPLRDTLHEIARGAGGLS